MGHRRRSCDQCLLLRINGIVCHESGCPNSWRDEIRECKECGAEFSPEGRADHFCSEDCCAMYHGIDQPEECIDLADDRVVPPGYCPPGWDHI